MRDYQQARWDEAVQERFWSKVQRLGDDDCWLWQDRLSARGYGQISIDNRHYAAHRLLYAMTVGITPELVCDHLCRNRSCVNPAHLEPVTNQENIRRGIAGNLNKQKGAMITHCPAGHEYTPENTRLHPRGSRCCRECGRISSAKHNVLRKAARALAASTKDMNHDG